MAKPLDWTNPNTIDDFIAVINKVESLPSTTAIFIRDKVYRNLTPTDYSDLLTELIPHFKGSNGEV
jgi:hypothetical protein